MINLRTDLALEASEIYKRYNTEMPAGVEMKTETKDGILITTVEVKDGEAAQLLNKPVGKYITLEGKIIKELNPETTENLSYMLKDYINELADLKENDTVLVVGLGNWNITPDALGPQVVEGTMVTKHLIEYIPEHIDDNLRPVCAVSPGVLGITGVESSDIVKGIAQKINPALIIAVDALASGVPGRISTTIQLTNTGITPGSGVGNAREGLNQDTLGVPVIAIGVPTVVNALSIGVDSATKILDILLKNSEENSELTEKIKHYKNDDGTISGLLADEEKELIVTPKEIDNLISHIAKVISNGINLALHRDIGLEYIESFTF